MRTKWLLIASPLIIFGVLAQSAFWVPSYSGQAAGNPKRLVTFIRSSIGDPKLLNPILYTDNAAGEVLLNNISEGLVDTDEDLKLVPRLAERWETTEVAYLAVLPDRKLPDGSFATAERLLSLIDAAWKAKQLGDVGESIQGLGRAAAETRTLTESVLVSNAKGKKEPVDVEMMVAVPERIELRLSKVEQELFKQLEVAVGASYFEGYPFADRFRLKKPELLPEVRERFPELLGIGEHNPVITFYLRPGVRWHDGYPVTAEDVKFLYQAATDPRNASPRASSFEPIKSVEVVNELTARVTYKRLYASGILDWQMELIPKHLLDDAGLAREMAARGITGDARKTFNLRNTNFNRMPIGTGPYRFVEWRPDQFITMTRNDQYWGKKPQYEKMYWRTIPDYLTTELEFQAGALDRYDALPHQAERYRKNPDYQVISNGMGSYSYIGYNLRRPLFRDVRVRRALGMAIDVNSIIRFVLYGEGRRATGPYYSNTPFNDPSVKPLAYDPQAAMALLAEAGWKKNARGMLEKDGKPFEFTLVTNNGNPQRKAIMTIAQEAWRRLGIDCKIQAFEWTVFLEDFVNPNQFDAYVLGWIGADNNPDKYQLWHSSQTDPYELNHVGYKNPRADALIERIRIEYDAEEVIRLTHEFHRLVAEDQPYTFLVEPTKPVVLDKRIVRVVRGADGQEAFEKVRAAHSGSVEQFLHEWRKLPALLEHDQR